MFVLLLCLAWSCVLVGTVIYSNGSCCCGGLEDCGGCDGESPSSVKVDAGGLGDWLLDADKCIACAIAASIAGLVSGIRTLGTKPAPCHWISGAQAFCLASGEIWEFRWVAFLESSPGEASARWRVQLLFGASGFTDEQYPQPNVRWIEWRSDFVTKANCYEWPIPCHFYGTVDDVAQAACFVSGTFPATVNLIA